jgi:hypothetical protein
VQSLTVAAYDMPGFTLDGVRHLTAVRELELPLSPGGVAWAGDAFRGLAHLTRLRLENPLGGFTPAPVHGPAGLFAPGALPRSLRRVTLRGLALEWPPGAERDGGAALLRPLAGVRHVSLRSCDGVGDSGLCELAGATRWLELSWCHNVAGERLASLGGALEELVVSDCDGFTGAGLGSLAALRRLMVVGCPAFRAGALVDVAAGCAALERVTVTWDVFHTPAFDAAATEAALLATAGGGGPWAFSRGGRAWAARRHPQRRAVLAPATGGVPVGVARSSAAGAAPAPVPAAGALAAPPAATTTQW